eukprot:2819125-Karenia_brevis.AAC.1
MRANQFMRSKCLRVATWRDGQDARRRRATVDEASCGLWAWKRDMELHLGSYRAAQLRRAEFLKP